MEDGCIQFMHVLLQKRVGSMLSIHLLEDGCIRDITVLFTNGNGNIKSNVQEDCIEISFQILKFWLNLANMKNLHMDMHLNQFSWPWPYKALTLSFDPNILFKIECEILGQNLLLVQMSSIWVVMGMMLCHHLPYVIFFHPAHQYNMK